MSVSLGSILALLAAQAAPGGFPPADPVLAGLIAESLERRPEIRRGEALVRAGREGVPRAGAFPDPVLALGIQNDGFDRIAIGEMETSFLSVMITQAFPWPGKRGLRSDVAAADVDLADAAIARVRLGTEAEVRRAYLALLLARERLLLLAELAELWRKSEGLARARYESGEGAQSDLLRAQLERLRLKQRGWALEAEARTALQSLNRLRAEPLDAPIETSTSLRALPRPVLLPAPEAEESAIARSPEIALARLGRVRAERQVALAEREVYPDFSVSLGIMPRGSLEPMWAAGVSFNLPVFAGSKQNRAVAESEARAESEKEGLDAVLQLLRLRLGERRAAFAAADESSRLYEAGLLVQSQATAESTMAQYQVGRVTFASVLEAVAGYLADKDGFLESLAALHHVAIAEGEVSLDPTASLGGAPMAGGAFPGAGASGATRGAASAGSAPAEAATGGASMKGM